MSATSSAFYLLVGKTRDKTLIIVVGRRRQD